MNSGCFVFFSFDDIHYTLCAFSLEYFTRGGAAQVFPLLMRFLLQGLVSRRLSRSSELLFSYFFFISARLTITATSQARGYHRRKWTLGPDFKSWMILLAFPIALILWERYESNYSPSSYGLIVEQTELFNVGIVTVVLHLKTNLVSHTALQYIYNILPIEKLPSS